MTVTFLHIDHWYINIETGEIVNSLLTEAETTSEERVDPLGIKLLILLARNQGTLVTKETLLAELWPNTVVSEDALSRCISRVRKILGDQPRQPKFIETLPKRGYRLVATHVEWTDSIKSQTSTLDKHEVKTHSKKPYYLLGGSFALLVLVLVSINVVFFEKTSSQGTSEVSQIVQQADVYYHRLTRQDNEMALELYQKAIAISPSLASAHSGLANSLVQRTIRLSNKPSANSWREMSLGQALSNGHHLNETNKSQLEKALTLSRKAVHLSPNNAKAHKALGFVLSAQNKLAEAILSYETALSLNPNAWDVLINVGDVYEISGQLTNAISYYKKAYDAINNQEGLQLDQSKQWQASLGAVIGDKYFQQNNLMEAEVWFRHVLSFAPFSAEATIGLANVLELTGQANESKRLCSKYTERIGETICD